MIVLQNHLGSSNMVIPSEVSLVENKNLPGLFHGGNDDGGSRDFYFDPDDMPYCTMHMREKGFEIEENIGGQAKGGGVVGNERRVREWEWTHPDKGPLGEA